MTFVPVTNIDFGSLASDVVTKFFKTGASLNDLTAEVAAKEMLNPNEVKRLVERVNTESVISMLKTSNDKKVEFDLASVPDVLQKTHAVDVDCTEQIKTASEFTSVNTSATTSKYSLPDTNAKTYDLKSLLDKHILEKTAEENIPKTDRENNAKLKHYFTMVKRKNELSLNKTSMEKSAQDSIDFVLSELSKQDAEPFTKFASNMYVLYKDTNYPVKPILEKLATALECAKYSLDDNDIVINDRTKIAKEFNNILKTAESIKHISSELETINNTINTFFTQFKK
jgi:hypothetical protein